MARRYRKEKKLKARHRERLMRVLLKPFFFRGMLPALLIAYGFTFAIVGVTHIFWPRIDTEGWRFIVPTIAATFAVGLIASAVAHAILIRWLIRYRSEHRSRAVALGDVLRPSNARHSLWRRLVIRAYGVPDAERARFTAGLSAGSDPLSTAPPVK
jgi:hypothetical protein